MANEPTTEQPVDTTAPARVDSFSSIGSISHDFVNADQTSIPGTPSSIGSDLPVSSLSSSLFLSETSSPTGLDDIVRDHNATAARTLVIPSLTIPQYNVDHDAERGNAIGNVKLWVLGGSLHECQAAADGIIKQAPLVSEVSDWVHFGSGVSVLYASTLSSAHNAFPTPLQESKWNVEVYVADVGLDSKADLNSTLESILAEIQTPFQSTDRLLNDGEPSTTSFLPLLTSSSTLLHTASIYLRSTPTTPHDRHIVNELSSSIPVVIVPPSSLITTELDSLPSTSSSPATSSLRPSSLNQFRDNLFLNSSTLHHLRTEAAERFLRWRDLTAALRSSMSFGSSSGSPESPTVHPLDLSWRRSERTSDPSTPYSAGRTAPIPISGARPGQTRPRASSTSAATVPSSIRSPPQFATSSSYTHQTSTVSRVPTLGTPRIPTRSPRGASALSGVAEDPSSPRVQSEQQQREWMWNWESRFSRDLRDKQQQLSAGTSPSPSLHRAGSSQSGSSNRGVPNSSTVTRGRAQRPRPPPVTSSSGATARVPLSTITASAEDDSDVFSMNLGSTAIGGGASTTTRRRRASTIRGMQQQMRRPLSPPILYDASPARSEREVGGIANDNGDDEGDDALQGEDDPLHLRSVVRLAASLLPALFRRYIPRRRRKPSRSVAAAAAGDSTQFSSRGGGISWRMFGLGVSVGVVISICIVGLGVELTNRAGLSSMY